MQVIGYMNRGFLMQSHMCLSAPTCPPASNFLLAPTCFFFFVFAWADSCVGFVCVSDSFTLQPFSIYPVTSPERRPRHVLKEVSPMPCVVHEEIVCGFQTHPSHCSCTCRWLDYGSEFAANGTSQRASRAVLSFNSQDDSGRCTLGGNC
jgi:hypothetical protein